jgi:nicotinamide-nucleotide amidase
MSRLTLLTEATTDALLAVRWQVAIAESCTGGLIAQLLTERPGSSHWFDRGFVTYSNAAKVELLGVPSEIVQQYGAVSQATVQHMVAGALARSQAQVAAAVTGIAGPGGGSVDKPVGLVWFGFAVTGQAPITAQQHFSGDRAQIREQAAQYVLQTLLGLARESLQGSQA